jgi:hypothetical protein
MTTPSYPGAIKEWIDKQDNIDDVRASDPNGAYAEIIAIETELMQVGYKPSVRVATTQNGALATAFANGQTVDGVVLATGDRILLKDQTNGAENGIYIVNASGAPTRTADANTSAHMVPGMMVYVREGTANSKGTWKLTTTGAITLGTTSLTFESHKTEKATDTILGHVKVDGTTIIANNGVISANIPEVRTLSSTDFPNLVAKLKAEIKDIAAVFIGDSGTWGQAATNYEATSSDPELAPFTNGNSFADKVSDELLNQLSVGAWQNTISVDGEDTYNQTIVAAAGYTETGTSWAGTVRAECLGGLYRTGKNNGEYAVFTPPNNVDYNRADIYFVKAVNAGKFKVYFKRAADADWILPSAIAGCTRSDSATGTDMDTVDAYYSTSTFQNIISYNLPSIDDWSIKLAVGDTKNAASTNYWIHLEGLRAYVVNSYAETGTSWVETVASEALDGLYRTGKTSGDYAVFGASGNTRKIQLYYTKSADAGIFKVYFKRASDADWLLPSAIANCRRTDNAVGTAMNTVDAYAAAISYQNTVTYILPTNEDWSIKVEVGNTKNALSSNYWLNLEGVKRSKSHSYNWGKGAHNTNEYRGIGHAVNHLKEVISYKPALVILQPMVINDFVDGIALTVMISNVKQMIKELRDANCDIVMILPPPIATTSTPWDYADGDVLDDTAKPWKYHEGIDALRGVARQLVVPLIDTYAYLEDEYNSVNHQYWFQTGSRTHTNQHGHDLFAQAIIKDFPLF